jgi:hypothetical protein
MNDIIEEFKAYLSISKDVSDVQSNCSKFLKAFITAGGSYGGVAIVLHDNLIETVSKEF